MNEPLPADPVARLLGRARERVAASRPARSRVARRLPRVGTTTWLAVALIGAQALLRGWATSRSWFMWDDYIFIADVVRGETGVGWLFRSHFSLLQPVGFAMALLVGKAGFAWWAYATHILLMQVAASVACWVMLRVLFGDRRLLLVPLTFYLASPFTVPGSVWWSVAIYQYPFHIGLFGAVTCHVVWLRRRRPPALLGTFAFTALALGSYIKAPLLVPVLVGISLLWFTAGPWRERLRDLGRQWPAWLGLGLLLAGYVALWLSRQTAAPPRQACEAPRLVETSVLETIGSGLAGGPWSWRLWTGGIDPFIAASDCAPLAYRGSPDLVVGGAPQSLATAPLALVALSWVVIVLLVVHRWARHRNALLVLWILVPYGLASVVLVFAGRAATFGSQVGAREVRYFADLAAVGAFGIAAAFLTIRGARTGPEPREVPRITLPLPTGLVRTLGMLFVAGSLVSTVTYVLPWHARDDETAFPERAFVAQVERSLAQREGTVTVADVPFPPKVANPVIAPYNLPSRKLAPLAPKLRAVTQGTDLEVLDQQGRLRPATVEAGPRAAPGEVENCGYLVQQARRTIEVAEVVPGGFWVRLDYLANADGFVDVTVGDMFRRVEVESGLHTMLFLSDGDFSEVELVASANLSVCIDNVRVGFVTPRGQEPPA